MSDKKVVNPDTKLQILAKSDLVKLSKEIIHNLNNHNYSTQSSWIIN